MISHPVIDVSCDFGVDLMIRSGKANCIYIQNLQWKPMGKIHHDMS